MSEPKSATAENFRARAFDAAPAAASMAAFLIGAAALIVAATPVLPPIPGFDLLEHFLDEAPEFTLSVAGAVLMALAVGLRRRLDTAWAASAVLLVFMGAYAVLRHEHYIAAGLCVVALLGLLASRRAFFRHAGLAGLAPARSWYIAIAFAFAVAVVGALLWAAERPGFAKAPWWSLFTDPHLGRPGRAILVGALALALVGAWRLFFSPMRRHPPLGGAADVARAAAMLERAESARPEAALALLGDKSFLFARNDSAFLMYARSGGSLIAMGGPVGLRNAWREALAAFREEAERESLRPVIYAAPPDLLPDLLDLGFKLEKIGESALVDLKSFSLSGKKRQDLRTARRRFVEREGASFEVEPAPHSDAHMKEYAAVSEAWLKGHTGAEKSFSLGRFDPDYVGRFAIAVVRVRGKPIAFANIWTTHDKAWASVDLMRHDPEGSPHGVMDFLFTELLLWAQAQGYSTFDLGMAPLSGLAEERYAPLFARFGRFVFERAGGLYNFEGLRKFKEKFSSSWEPRYLAAPGAWSMPIVLAEAALLTSGGAAGLIGLKPSSASAAGPSRPPAD